MHEVLLLVKQEKKKYPACQMHFLPCNLIVFFKARDHQHLFEQLRALRESIKCSWLHKQYWKKSGNPKHLFGKDKKNWQETGSPHLK
jgi:hypothetical protein